MTQDKEKEALARRLLTEYWRNYGQKRTPSDEWFSAIPQAEYDNWCRIADFILAD